MSNTEDTFFEGKRSWSKIKDQVLKGYMPAYLAKVAKLRRPILLIDGYAGPGLFEEGQEIGSPLIMCEAAEKYVPGQYKAVFINHKKGHHEQLTSALSERGWLKNARPILGDASAFLEEIAPRLSSHTVFVYLDPFGLKGCEFATLKPFLARNKAYSTEIVLNVSMPITHRLAAEKKVRKDGMAPIIVKYHQMMTNVFGGTYWHDIYFSDGLDAEQKETMLMSEYRNRIAQHLPYTGACPVREKSDRRIKYFITFASRHPDAMLLMNDEMCKAYFGQMHEADFSATLFEALTWKEMRTRDKPDSMILAMIAANPGLTRDEIWLKFVQNHFMQYTASDYKKSVNGLVQQQKIKVQYTATGRINGDCRLFPSVT